MTTILDIVSVVLLGLGAGQMLVRPRGTPVWIGPVIAASLAVAVTAVPIDHAVDALRTMRDPLLFLAFAVPLATALDRIGVFEALAALVDGGRHLAAWLWVLGASVTIVFNLDAAVVLLTPLYVRIAHRNSLPAETLAFQPALLACLASQPLPVSNLTNLLVADRFDLSAGDFVRHLALPTVVAVAVGWWRYRKVLSPPMAEPSIDVALDRAALRRGLPIVAFVLIGFTLGDAVDVPAWSVASAALVAAVVVGRRTQVSGGTRVGRIEEQLRLVPFEAMAVAAGLAVLVAGASPQLGLDQLLSGEGAWGRLQALMVGAVGADLTNNLPMVLAAMPALGSDDQVWPLLIGVNVAPAFVLTGALSSLLWRDTAARLGVQVSARRFASVGVRVGLPAFVAAGLVVVFVP